MDPVFLNDSPFTDDTCPSRTENGVTRDTPAEGVDRSPPGTPSLWESLNVPSV